MKNKPQENKDRLDLIKSRLNLTKHKWAMFKLNNPDLARIIDTIRSDSISNQDKGYAIAKAIIDNALSKHG